MLLLCIVSFFLNVPRASNGMVIFDRSNSKLNTPIVSSGSNRDLIDSVFDAKVLEYQDLEYFKQLHEPSLQATYEALYILDALGKLDRVNQTASINYVMSHYDIGVNRFMDTLAFRYLDTNFSQMYYPLSSVLEANCYAVLSLDILGSLDLIDGQEMINFIWSCYNPVSSGFIGQSYDADLEDGFKTSTADNTYHAVIALDLLMNDWAGHASEKNDIIQFVNDLQLPGGGSWSAGGFLNDEDAGIDSLYPLFEPNLLSSYYAMKTLEVFGLEDSIRTADFHQFLTNLYDTDNDYFRVSYLDYGINYTNIVATAIGLELSDITNFGGIDRNGVINFILMNRNSKGNWDQSTRVVHHELIDTFQIMRSLKNSQEITQLTFESKNQIGNATQLYYQTDGYSQLSNDYTSMNLIHSIASSFDLFGRMSELDIQSLYESIKDSYIEHSYGQYSAKVFSGYLIKTDEFIGLRTHPIEYYSSGNRDHVDEISFISSHESTHFALDSLRKIFKLDDFALEFDLLGLIDGIIASQFLNDSYYDNFGAFTPMWPYMADRSEFLNARIFFEYSYHAMRSLEILADHLSLNLLDLNFDKVALYSYVDRNIVETPSMLYFDPKYTSDLEVILENTYYMIRVLQALNSYNKNSQKIKNFVESSLDYDNIKNIYYSYKISELLDLDISFDSYLAQELVQILHSGEYNEFYLTSDREAIGHEVFSWICDMARNSEIRIEAHYSSVVPLGGHNHVEVSLYNLVVRDFGTYITFKFESDQVGTHVFSKSANDTYAEDISIPINAENHPTISGFLRAYEGTQLKAEFNVSFSTSYTLSINELTVNENPSGMDFFINGSILSGGISYPLSFGRAFINIHVDGQLIDEQQFAHQEYPRYSLFSLTFEPDTNAQYYFEIFLNDGIQPSVSIGNVTFGEGSSKRAFSYEKEIQIAIPIMVVFMVVPGSVIAYSTKQLKESKKALDHKR